jgi:hypothetical protein
MTTLNLPDNQAKYQHCCKLLDQLKNDLLKKLDFTEDNRFLIDDSIDQFYMQFDEEIDGYLTKNAGDFYINENDLEEETFSHICEEFLDEARSLQEDEIESRLKNGDQFECLFKKAFEKADLEIKNEQDMDERDVRVYVYFIRLLEKELYPKEIYKDKRTETVSVWHIEQNAMKYEHEGKESIRTLCRTAYFNMEADLTPLTEVK